MPVARTLHEPTPGSEPSASKATTAWRVASASTPPSGGPEEDLVVVEREADRQDDGERVHGDGHPPEPLTGEQPEALGGRQHLRIGAIERHATMITPSASGSGRAEGPFLAGPLGSSLRRRARRGGWGPSALAGRACRDDAGVGGVVR